MKRLLVIMVLMMTSGLAFTADDFFIRLHSNYADMEHGSAVFEVRNPFNKDITIDGSLLSYFVRWNNTPIINNSIYLWKDFNYSCKTNITTAGYGENETEIGWNWTTCTGQGFQPLGIETFKKRTNYLIAIQSFWEQKKDFWADWVPVFCYDGVCYYKFEWQTWAGTELLYEEFTTMNNGWTGWGIKSEEWNLTNSVGPWYNDTDKSAAQAYDTDGPPWAMLNKSVNLYGWKDINISFWVNTTGNDAGEGFKVKYWNGFTWTQVFHQQGNGVGWNYTSIMLDAQDIADFKISFVCENNLASEFCELDTVRITGWPTNDTRWIRNGSFISGLISADVGSYSNPSIYMHNGVYWFIAGNFTGLFGGWTWNGGSWVVNNTIVTGLTDVGTYSGPSMYPINGVLSLISSNYTKSVLGWTWNGTSWVANDTIIGGLSGLNYGPNPTMFELNELLSIIIGEYDGGFKGWTWNGGSWVVNNTIIGGLSSVGERNVPCVYGFNGLLFLIAGNTTGNFIGWTWNGTSWVANDTITAGLNKYDTYSTPSMYQINGALGLISGVYGGGFYSWTWYNNATGGEPPATGNSTTLVLNYPADASTNSTTKNITFGYTPTAYGTTIANATLWTNESGSWARTKLNLTAITNATVNTIQHNFTINGTYKWTISVWDSNGENFTVNRTLVVAEPEPPPLTYNTTTTTTVTPASPITYGTASNFSCLNNASLYTDLLLNGTNKTTEMNTNLVRATAVYNVTCKAYGNATHNGSEDTKIYTVNKATSIANLTLNGTDGDRTYANGSTMGLANTTTPTMLTGAYYINVSGWTSITDTTVLNYEAGDYLIHFNVTGNDNYTGISANHTLTLTDSTPPAANQTIVNLGTPTDGYAETGNATIDFTFTPIFKGGTIDSCTLNVSGTEYANQTAVQNNTQNTIQATLADSNYTWNVTCESPLNISASRTLYVDICTGPWCATNASVTYASNYQCYDMWEKKYEVCIMGTQKYFCLNIGGNKQCVAI